MNHIFMARIQAFSGRTSLQSTLAAMPRKLLNGGDVNCRIIVSTPYHEAHVMAFLCQLYVQNFNVCLQVIVSVSCHAFNLSQRKQ